MVPHNILQRTIHFGFGNQSGSGFLIDVSDNQYLITAAHIIKNNADSNPIPKYYHNKKWVDLQGSLLGICPDDIDIAVFALKSHLIDPKEYPTAHATSHETFLSQDVFFLGFPYGLSSEIGTPLLDFPMPLVKKACLSMVPSGDHKYMILDGHNNIGFSGGPVVYTPQGSAPNAPSTSLAGVIAGYRYAEETVFLKGLDTGAVIRANTGLVMAYPIEYAIELITKETAKMSAR